MAHPDRRRAETVPGEFYVDSTCIDCAVCRDLAARAERARMQTRLYAEGVLPQSRSALDSAAASYAAGRTEFLTLIADFLTVLDTEKSLATQQAEEASALAALEPLTGMTLLTPTEGDRHE